MTAVTVVCVRWGDKYSADYVLRLRAAFARHLSIAHRFICVTSEPIESVDCVAPACPFEGWWQKVGLFAPGFLFGPTVYCDLDMLLVRSIDWVADYFNSPLACIENWGSRPRQGPLYEDEISSAFMIWRGCGGPTDAIFERFTPAVISRLSPHGDQTWITEIMRGKFDLIPQERVCSYKRHCRDQGAPPETASVVAFHGRPMPHEVSDAWVREAWG